MSFDSLLDRTCTIEENAVAQDSVGQKIKTWSTALAGVACRLDPLGGGIQERPPVVYENATHELFMRAQTGITLTTKEHRIVIGSDTYTILLVQDLHGSSGTHHLELILERDE